MMGIERLRNQKLQKFRTENKSREREKVGSEW